MSETPARKFLRAATPIVAAVFLVSATTGVLLFFHLGERLIKELHEWMGVVFVVAALLHIVRNGRALLAHGRKPALWIAGVLALAAAAVFIVPELGAPAGGGNDGIRKLIGVVQRTPIVELAPLLATSPAELVARLEAAGLKVAGTSASIAEVATASDRPPREVLELALAGLPAPAPPPGR